MASGGSVEFLGSLYSSEFMMAMQNGEKITNEEREKKIKLQEAQEQRENALSNLNAQKMLEVKKLLKKAGIKLSSFPFKPVKGKDGQIEGFVPKSDNPKEIKEDVEKYKEKLEEALEKGKLTQEEYEELNENLEDLLKENGIEIEEEEEKLEVSDEEIADTLNAVIYRCFGDNYDLNGIKENYENADLESKENFLTRFNSEINKKLKIAGELKFTNMDLNFEDSFSYKGKGGYFLSTSDIDVEGKDLKNVLYGMVERSMIRKAEMAKDKIMSPEQKRALHEKILQDKQKREEELKRSEEKRNRENARKLIRQMDKAKNL